MAERKKYKHLRWEDRLKMEGALKTGAKPDEIAEMLGCCRATVYNEIKRGQCLQQHDAEFVMQRTSKSAVIFLNFIGKPPGQGAGAEDRPRPRPGQLHRGQDHPRPLLPLRDPGLHQGTGPAV